MLRPVVNLTFFSPIGFHENYELVSGVPRLFIGAARVCESI